ncbi:hypothetical protein BDQ17DRAFT_1329494 [Cyathus striatus]|nr:hypothetical protein BDQ17DRAFT_1329494 [Cyathus striatus]
MFSFQHSLKCCHNDLEVKYMWKTNWTITKLAFVYLQYMTLVESVILISSLTLPGIMVGEILVPNPSIGSDITAPQRVECGFDGGSQIISVMWIALMVYDASAYKTT